MAVSLPQDVILFQNITRVPTKSVVRFKCVSNQWNSSLMSDKFKEMHNDCNLLKDFVCPHLEHQNLFFLSQRTATFYTINCESPPDNAPCSRPLPQFVARSPPYTRILTSFHELVCLGVKKNQCGDFDIILWNPVTTEYKRLSKPSNPDQIECYQSAGRVYGLYYRPGEDDYKLLVVTKSGNAYIYSLKSDSWIKLDTKPPFQDDLRPGFCLNKNLYFLSYFITDESMRFDTKAKRFHKIKNPPVPDGYSPCTDITVEKGSILCVMYGSSIKLWKFIADEDIWRKVVTYKPNDDILDFSPVHLTSNGNLLMIDYNECPTRVFKVDLKKKNYTKDKKDGHKNEDKNKSIGNYHDEYFRVQDVIYTETFVSPNRYTK